MTKRVSLNHTETDSEDRSSGANNVLKEEQQTYSRQVQRSLESGKQSESSNISHEESTTNKSGKDEAESQEEENNLDEEIIEKFKQRAARER